MDRLEDFRDTMESCNHCGQCKWLLAPKMTGREWAEICPLYHRYGFDACSGQGLLNIAAELLDGKLKYESGLVDLVYSCTMCGACDINCKSVRDMEVLDTILALRTKCAEDGQLPAAHRETAARIAETGNCYGLSGAARGDWAKSLLSEIGIEGGHTDAHGGIAFFAGCAASFKQQQIARDSVRILRAGDVRFTILGADEFCCGALLWRTGQEADAREAVLKNLRMFRARGITKLITSCAECYGMFRSGYPRFAGTSADLPQVMHISEVAAELLAAGRIRPDRALDMKVCYHDPCMLGRLSEPYVPWDGVIGPYGVHTPPKPWRRGTFGTYAPPREMLRAIPGITLIEAPRNTENAYCCGAGGGTAAAYPEFAGWVASERLREIDATGADAIVSGCPFCAESFRGAIAAAGSTMGYFDLSRLLAASLGLDDTANTEATTGREDRL